MSPTKNTTASDGDAEPSELEQLRSVMRTMEGEFEEILRAEKQKHQDEIRALESKHQEERHQLVEKYEKRVDRLLNILEEMRRYDRNDRN